MINTRCAIDSLLLRVVGRWGRIISGYKNAALGIIAAAIMTDETVKIENVPILVI